MSFLSTSKPSTYMLDVVNHLNDLLGTVADSRNSLNQLQANYLSKLSVDFADSTRQTNRAVKVYSIIITIATPVSAISGIGGVNLYYPNNISITTNFGPMAIFLMTKIAIMIFLLLLFKLGRYI